MQDDLNSKIGKAVFSGKYDDMTMSEFLKLFNENKIESRKIQYYEDKPDNVWCYFVSGSNNPCGCGSNCYHHTYDGEEIICVCNACKTDIYVIKDEYTEEELNKGIWK